MNAKRKILVLEDEKPLAHALELKLTHEGFEVETAENGENIVATLEKSPVSLIVCDMLMPKVDGFQVLQILKDNKIKVPVVVLTNLSQGEDEKRVRELGAVDFLVKSDSSISEVVEKLKTYLV